MSVQPEEHVESHEPPPDVARLGQWVRSLEENQLPLVKDACQKLATLTGAVLGGSVALINSIPAAPIPKALGLVALLLALPIAVYGALPIPFRHTDEVHTMEAAYEELLGKRRAALQAAWGAFVFGMLCFVGGVVWYLLNPQAGPPPTTR